MKRRFFVGLVSLALVVLLIGFVSTWADNGNSSQNVNGCNQLNTTGAVYTLTQNVSSNGTCFTIAAANITLDCNGYWINYSTNGTNYFYGVYTSQFNTTIKNCNIIDGNLASSGTERFGIYLYTSTYSTVSNCILLGNNSPTIALIEAHSSRLINNTARSGNRAIHFLDTNNTLIINNTGNSTLNYPGIHLYGTCSNNTFINNTVLSRSYSLLLESNYPTKGASNNILINNTFISTQSTALFFSGSDNNIITNQIADGRGAYAIDFGISANNTFRDCIDITGANQEISLGWDSGSFKNVLINCSYGEEYIPVIENWMLAKWYYQAYVNYTNGTPASNINITAYNFFGNIEFTTLTNSSGWISRQEVTDYNATRDGRVYYSNYTIFANKSGAISNDTNVVNVTATYNKLNDWFTIEESTEDSTPPTYTSISHNSTLANYSVLFSLYISDNFALNPDGQYTFSTNNTGQWVNDTAINFTSTPSWANVTKKLNSTVGMIIGYRWYFNDSSGNTNSTGVYILNITSVSLFPYFTTIPNNASLFYGNQSLGVDFDATDSVGFGYYSINDTRFSINQSGYLSNATSLAVGNYEINLTINNTLGNINWTRYKVQINKSVSEVYLYMNNLRNNITISNGSSIWLNGTLQKGVGTINLYNNGSLINSASSPIYNFTQFNNTGLYNITVIYSGNENYTSDYETWWVNVSNYTSSNVNQIIANHTIVDRYDDIPQYYINEVKKMLVDMGGESHSMGYQNGVNLLELYNSKFQVQTYEDTSPPADTNQYLRLGRPHMYGEDIWTSQTGIDDLISDIDSQNDTGNPFDVFGFGWCWDMTWENLPGGTEDPVFNVHWAGSSEGGPNGSMRWGLDAEDEDLTGNSVSMDNYLDAIEQYNTYFESNNIPTIAIFTTGPVDSYTDENAYQRELKHDYIRNYTFENASRILFDYADILYYNDSGNKYTEEWNDSGDMREYAQIHPDNLLNYNSTWGMEDTGDPDSDHIGEVGTLRIAKAMWWMLARIAGWDGQNNTAPVTSLSSPSNGSSLSSGQITFQCNLTDDYDLKNITLYVWNSTGNLISYNLSSNVSGTTNFTNINYTLNVDGTYLWNCLTYDGDSVANFSVNNNTLFISSIGTSSPVYNLASHNSTLANYSVLFSINVSDETSLNNSGGYIFSTNNTGQWINDSFILFTSTPSWANVTKKLNSTVGMVIGYRWYFNDSSGNTNSTGVYTLATEQGCGVLSLANAVYTLTQNVSSTGTCFTISAANITLDCNGYWINYSIGGGENTYGVYSNQFNTTVKNCSVYDENRTSSETTRYGIYFSGASNSTLLNNFINASNSIACYTTNSDFNNLTSNRIYSSGVGLSLAAGSDNYFLFNNTIVSDSTTGFNSAGTKSIVLSNNINGTTAISFGIQNSNLTNNTIIGVSSRGLYGGGSNNNLTGNIITGYTHGIMFSGASNNTLMSNVITGITNTGIYLYSSSKNNLVINNTGIGTAGILLLLNSNDNTFINNTANGSVVGASVQTSVNTTFISNNVTGPRAYEMYSSNSTNVSDCVYTSGTNYDVYLNYFSIDNTFINCSYNSNKEYLESNSNLTRKWYYQAYSNYTNGTAVADANISAYSTTGKLQFTELTNSSGWISRQEVTEYINLGGTRSYYNNYTINASLAGYDTDSNVFNFTTTQNKIDDVFTLNQLIPGENSCGVLDSASTVYTLTRNVSSQGTCFNITAQNVTLDCNGYWINYSQSEFGYGINITGIKNITIKNCNIFGGVEENYTHGIFVYNSTNINLSNNNINTLGDISDGISIYISNYTLMNNNTIINSGNNGHGIYTSFSSYNNITNSNINAAYYGIYLEYNSNNHNFSNIDISSNYGAGIVLNASADNNLFYNVDIAASSYAQGLVLSSDSNYLYDLDIASNLGESMKISGSNNNISLSRFNSSNNNSVYFEGGEENLFVNNTLLSLSGNVNSSLLKISSLAYNNSFYWNNFTETFGYYINNSNSSNKFNTTMLGVAQGNEYLSIFYKRIYDTNSNWWGDSGEEYPINSTNWIDKWAGYGQDYGPRTFRLEDSIAPIYNLVSHNNTIAGEISRFRINISDNYRLYPNGQYIFSTNNTGVWINDSAINFTSTPYLVNTIKTLNSSLNKVIGYRWYLSDFSGNTNSTGVYTLKTEEEEEDEDSKGGGGGGSEDETVILKPSYPQVQEGYETPISKGYLIQFNLSEKGQYVADIEDVNRFTGVINLSINHTNYSVSLNKSIKINLNNDTYYDLEASVLTITFFNTSRMLFKEIHESIYSSSSPGVNETSLGNKTVVDFFWGDGKDNSFKFVYILIIAVIIVLISLVGYITFMRLKRTLSLVEHKNL